MPKVTIDYNPKYGTGTVYYGNTPICDIRLPDPEAKIIRELIIEHITKDIEK